MILIRTNLDKKTGLGHYIRMVRLAKEMSLLKKVKLVFVLDKPNYEFESKEFNHHYLYKSSLYKNEKDDSKKIKNLIKKLKVKTVVVDDYRLGLKWETSIKNKNVKLVVIDDFIFKKHNCDYLVNYKLLSNQEINKIKKNNNKKTKLLLGPKYSILNKKIKLIKKIRNYNITFYAGGGGDPEIFFNLIKKLCRIKNIKINLIISLNKSKLKNFIILKRKYKNFKIIYKDCYDSIISKSQIYIGCQGNAIYDNSYIKLVSIFFSNSVSQQNDQNKLNKLGHYFLINKSDFKYTDKLIKLIEKILNKFDFIKKESFSKISSLDKYGSKRIAQTIIGIKQVKYSGPKKNYDKNFLIKRVNIRDINQYLLHRNQKINMKRMINFKKISALDHYNWWLSNDFFARKTFKVISGNKILLYIWHKNIKINNSSYYVGGWFVANKECKISDVYASLKWQLKTTRSKNKKWIAVINMNNKIVLKLNNLLGFSKDFNSKKDYKNSKNFFQVSPKKFSYQIYPT